MFYCEFNYHHILIISFKTNMPHFPSLPFPSSPPTPCPFLIPPSSTSLPPLTSSLYLPVSVSTTCTNTTTVKHQTIITPLLPSNSTSNSESTIPECTSLALHPAGRLVLAGFTDGSVRGFDLRGGVGGSANLLLPPPSNPPSLNPSPTTHSTHTTPPSQTLASLTPKGLHTTMLHSVSITADGRFGFAGVLRGSGGLLAIELEASDLEVSERNCCRHANIHN